MARFIVNDVLNDVAVIVDQDPTLATGTDLSVRIQLADQAQREWENNYQPKELRQNQFAPSITLSMTSLALPTNFKKLMSRPFNMALTAGNDYEEIRPEEAYQRFILDANNRYCYVAGNDVAGKYMVFNPALPSGASILFDYQMYPSSLATVTDTVTCPSRTFMYKKIIAKIYESRADTRFPQFNSEADSALANMMAEEAAPSRGYQNQTRNQYDRQNFRIGQEG